MANNEPNKTIYDYGPRTEMYFFDRLPKEIRNWLNNIPIKLSARVAHTLFVAEPFRTKKALFEAYTHCIEEYEHAYPGLKSAYHQYLINPIDIPRHIW